MPAGGRSRADSPPDRPSCGTLAVSVGCVPSLGLVPCQAERMTLVSERIGQFFHDGHRLEYTEYGGGDRWVVLMHGQLMPRRMHQPLARYLAARDRTW